jgi:hypothetical protein
MLPDRVAAPATELVRAVLAAGFEHQALERLLVGVQEPVVGDAELGVPPPFSPPVVGLMTGAEL